MTATTSAAAGRHDIDVTSLAKSQRTVSSGFASPTASLNSGMAMSYSLSIGTGASAVTTSIDLADGQDNLRGLADAINAANKGVTAQIVNTGDATNPYKLVLLGQTGAANTFTLSPSKYSMGGVQGADDTLGGGSTVSLRVTLANGTVTTLSGVTNTPNGIISALSANPSLGLSASLTANPSGSAFANKLFVSGAPGFKIEADYGGANTFASTLVAPVSVPLTNNQNASDAQISVDGVSYTRSSNTFNDVLTGVTFNLKSLTSSTQPVTLTRDTSSLKSKFDAVVSAYNDAMTIFNEVSNPKSTLDTYGASLVGDSTVRSLRQQLRDMFATTSSTPGSSVSALWQMGLTVNEKGVMSLDATKLDTVAQSKYDDMVKALTGNQDGLTTYSTTPGGIAGDAVRKIGKMLANTGTLATQTSNAEAQNTKYQADLSKLQTRMDALLARYQKQFASMDSLVGNVNSQKTSLKSTFDGMMSMYTNK